jgi:23S rRNA (adenine2030-N6)-methyltransferase
MAPTRKRCVPSRYPVHTIRGCTRRIRDAMNYRHAFHAGNFADVFKHTVLIGLIESLKLKPAPLCYLDTHAGRGGYDLRGPESGQTREHAEGVQRVLAAATRPAAIERYVNLLRSFNDDAASVAHYPGSPLIASWLLRADDRAILCELHPEEAVALRRVLQGDARCSVHQRDGYEALKALLPPAQKRGLVLIDPPFEAQGDEFLAIQDALRDTLARWPNAVIAVWYPIKLRETITPFHRWLRENSGNADALIAELLLHPDNSALRLNGCGMAILNPPWQFDQEIADWLPSLKDMLAQGRYGSTRIEWLKTA